MKCKLLIGFLIINILTQISVLSQPVYFNNTYYLSDPGIWSSSKTLIGVSDGYVICGMTYELYRIGVLKLDLYGNELWHKNWGDNTASWYLGSPGSLCSFGDQFYITGSKNYYSPYSYDVGLLMKLNNEWDTVWTKDYNLNEDDDPDTSLLFNQMDICYNGDLILAGGLYKASTVSFTKFLLARVDTSGNLLWHRTYSYSNRAFNVNDGYSVIQTSDGGFALGGFWYVIGSSSETGDAIIVKTDSLGNEEWMKNLGGPYEDDRAWLCRSTDGNIIVGTVIADSATTPHGGSYLHINILKIDNEGNFLWDKKYGPTEYENYLSNIHCLEDGSIICTGSIWTPQTWNVGWILKLNSNGDSIWYRQYHNISGQYSFNYLRDITTTSDSGFVACGRVIPAQPDTGLSRVWVLKVDSLGCDTAGCDPTVGIEDDRTVRRYDGKTMRVELWPNPCTEVLSFKFLGLSSGFDLSIQVFDIFGRKVGEETLFSTRMGGSREGGGNMDEGRMDTWMMDVSSLLPGLYLLVVKDGQRVLGSAKFVVAR